MAKVLIGNFKGPKGDKGDKGDPGTAATIQVGTTQTVQPEENAEVTNSGTTTAAVLNFKIPRGEDGMTDLTAEYKDASEYTCQPTVNAPVVVKGLDGKTEQGENPTPDNPQVIKGVGGMGYFDGVWVQGNISSTGSIGTEATGITSANAIPCKQNDNIAVTYEDSIDVIAVAFYNASGAYISTSTSGNSADTFTATAPANAASFKVNLRVASGGTITPSTAKYCTVTINGEYQTGVEVMGKNWFNINGNVNTQGNDYQQLNVNTVSGNVLTCNVNSVRDNGVGQIIGGLKGKAVTFSAKVISLGTGNSAQILVYENGNHNEHRQSTSEVNSVIKVTYTIATDNPIFTFTATNGTGAQFTDIQVEIGETNTEWEPYHHTALTIPLTSPLYEGDKICYVKPGDKYVNADGDTVTADGVLYGCYRENAVAVFDGSEDENWKEFSSEANPNGKVYLIMDFINGKDKHVSCISNRFKSYDAGWAGLPLNCSQNKDNAWGCCVESSIADVSSFKTWLQSHNVTVVVKLSQPYFEPFVDQSIFYSLRTDDILTYIYSSDPIEPVLTVEVAKNSTGGYLLESYAQAQKNAISEANSQSRISAIEQQLVNQATTPTE